MAKKKKLTEKENQDFQEQLLNFKNHEVIEDEEATIIIHHNEEGSIFDDEEEPLTEEELENLNQFKQPNEDEFWNAFSMLKVGKGQKKVGSIEKEMSMGTKTGWDLWKFEITKLNRHERIAWATLKDDALFGEIVCNLISSKRNEKGWLEKKLFRYFAEHMKAFTNVYENKNIDKALSKLNSAMRG